MVALGEAHAVNVAAVSTVLPANRGLRNARPFEQFDLEEAAS